MHPKAQCLVTHDDPWETVYKLGGKFFKSTQEHNLFDVVAWHGNYMLYKYESYEICQVNP
jgi:homogentisate 1,2-dioxygenase